MKFNRLIFLILVAILSILISACSPEVPSTPKMSVLPDINDENCKTENIATIEDKVVMEKFADLCIRRNTFKPSPKMVW